jgi:hypothetical protein
MPFAIALTTSCRLYSAQAFHIVSLLFCESPVDNIYSYIPLAWRTGP